MIKQAHIEQLNAMSEAEIEALMATEVPEELQKIAQTEVVANDFAQALYAYGTMIAQAELAEEGEDLSKEAQEKNEEEAATISAIMEEGFNTLIAPIEDPVELQKEAHAAAEIIHQGYEDTIHEVIKEAAKKEEPGTLGKAWEKTKKYVSDADKKVTGAIAGDGSNKARVAVSKHYGKGLGAAAALGGLAYAYKKHQDKKMDKTASAEMTVEDLAFIAGITSEIEKIAAKKPVSKMTEALTSLKDKAGEVGNWMKANKGKAAAAATGVAAAGGLATYIAKKKDDKK